MRAAVTAGSIGKWPRGVAGLCALALLCLWPLRSWAQVGFFHVENQDGIWWLVNPQGQPTLSIGVDHISYRGDATQGGGPAPYFAAVQKQYPTEMAWDLGALARLERWGFNTVGAWSDPSLWNYHVPYVMILGIAAHAGANWQKGKPVDVFAPVFPQVARQLADQAGIPRTGDHNLIGYFSDNELRWGADWRGRKSMLMLYLAMPLSAPGHQHAADFLRQRYHDNLRALARAWGIRRPKDFDYLRQAGRTAAYQSDAAAFLAQVAARYFQVCASAIHQADPNHLYLGARFSLPVPDAVLAAARIADVVSVNIYARDPRPIVRHIYRLTGKPILVTEFAFRAQDSGLPNTRGAGPKVPNQAARGAAYRQFVTDLESQPEAIGYHWFEWADEPAQGRFDGENSNYGLVNIRDQPYQQFVAAVRAANLAAAGVHAHSEPPETER
ncbi:MAG: hypothetical protein ACRD2E_08310 [Terriglobales bacterium]